jgi:hypothetical protein
LFIHPRGQRAGLTGSSIPTEIVSRRCRVLLLEEELKSRHPQVVAVLTRRGELDVPSGSRHDDALGEESRWLNVRVVDLSNAGDEHCDVSKSSSRG